MNRSAAQSAWVVQLPRTSAQAAAALRLAPRVEVCDRSGDEWLWLRGPALDAATEPMLQRLPGARRFALAENGALTPMGCLLPVDWQPAGPWQSIADWAGIVAPRAGNAARLAERCPWTLRRTTTVAMPTVLLLPLSAWRAYVEIAPQVRLDRWRFAADVAGRVLVCGTPLPPLDGELWTEQGRLLTPAGWTWDPPVPASVVAQLLQLQDEETALLHPHGEWEVIRPGDWTKATRAAVRAMEVPHVG